MSKLLSENQEIIDANAFPKYNNIVISDIQADEATGYMDIVPESLNSYGAVHGGAYFTLADTVAAFAARSDGRTYVTQSANSQFVRGVQNGRITAKGSVINRGRTFCLIDVKVYDENQKLVFFSTFNYYCIDR